MLKDVRFHKERYIIKNHETAISVLCVCVICSFSSVLKDDMEMNECGERNNQVEKSEVAKPDRAFPRKATENFFRAQEEGNISENQQSPR